jgi:CheY-like chemotaxis protein
METESGKTGEKKVLVVLSDLFFSVQINDAAKRLGMRAEFLKDRDTVLRKARENPSLVILDLNCDAAAPIEIIRALKGDPATKHIRLIGFVSHVQTDLKQEAERSGCEAVFARSAFVRNLPSVLNAQ